MGTWLARSMAGVERKATNWESQAMWFRRMFCTLSVAALLMCNARWRKTKMTMRREAEASEAEASEAEDEEEVVEEMVVTGSFIRRDNFDLPSPIATLDELDLELAATPDLGDIIFDQTFQVGVNAYSAPFEFGGGDDQNWQQGGEVWANLRGLGTRATMTMMDGHRVPANVTGYSWWTPARWHRPYQPLSPASPSAESIPCWTALRRYTARRRFPALSIWCRARNSTA